MKLNNMVFSSFYSLDSYQDQVLWYLSLLGEMRSAHQCLLTINLATKMLLAVNTCHMCSIPGKKIFFASISRKGVGENNKIQARGAAVLLDDDENLKKKIHGTWRKKKGSQNHISVVIFFEKIRAFSVIKSTGFGARQA